MAFKIIDEDSAEAWLKTHSDQRVHVAFATRAALRGVGGLGFAKPETLGRLALLVLRAMLTSGVAGTWPTPEVSEPVKSAAYSAAATAAAYSAAATDSAITAAAAAAYSACEQDAGFLESMDLRAVFKEPLWPKEPRGDVPADEPNGLAEGYAKLTDFFDSDPQVWGFWKLWLEGMRNGQPMDWGLQEQVALIPDDIWEAGPEAVAKEIRRIQFDHLTRIDRRVVFDEDAQVFRLETDPTPPEDALSFACKRVGMALQNALTAGPANGLTEDSYETVAIKTALVDHPDDASVIAVSFIDACMSLDVTIGDIYPDHPALTNLKNALWTTVEEITENDAPAKARVERYFQLGKGEEWTQADQDAVPKIVAEVAPLTDAELDARLRETGDLLAQSSNPPRSARARFANWITTIVSWLDKTKKGVARAEWLVKQVERLRKWFPDQD